MLDSLTARIARAVHVAVADLRAARVAWGSRAVWGYTRIRSLPAMLHNIPPPAARPDAPSTLFPEHRLAGPELAMLRADQPDPPTGRDRPAGPLAAFPMH